MFCQQPEKWTKKNTFVISIHVGRGEGSKTCGPASKMPSSHGKPEGSLLKAIIALTPFFTRLSPHCLRSTCVRPRVIPKPEARNPHGKGPHHDELVPRHPPLVSLPQNSRPFSRGRRCQGRPFELGALIVLLPLPDRPVLMAGNGEPRLQVAHPQNPKGQKGEKTTEQLSANILRLCAGPSPWWKNQG